MTARLYGAIEAGGTKTVCAVGRDDGELLETARIATTDPHTTLSQAVAFLHAAQARHGALTAIGIASFGPLQLDPGDSRFGHVLQTPKAGWSGADLLAPFRAGFGLPVALDTDVNGAALAEWRWGAGQGLDSLVYVTVGTGIGGGVLIAGQPLHGLMHAELGHLRPQRHRDDEFPGACPFHQNCFEGLASGTAIQARWRQSLQELAPDHPAWEIEADYLGQLCAQIALALSPRRIIMGGGVMQQQALFPPLRRRLRHWLGGYVEALASDAALERFVVPPALADRSGVLGALALAVAAR